MWTSEAEAWCDLKGMHRGLSGSHGGLGGKGVVCVCVFHAGCT